MMLTDAVGRRPPWPNRSRDPLTRVAKSGSVPSVPSPEVAHGVPVLAVPLAPPGGKLTEVIATPADVPGLRDQLHLRQGRVLTDRLEERGLGVEVAARAPEAGREVESESVHVHLLHPIAQRVHHQAQRRWLMEVEGVATPGVVDVMRAVVCEPVVHGVVDPAEAQGRPPLAALGGVVEYHVEDHL